MGTRVSLPREETNEYVRWWVWTSSRVLSACGFFSKVVECPAAGIKSLLQDSSMREDVDSDHPAEREADKPLLGLEDKTAPPPAEVLRPEPIWILIPRGLPLVRALGR